MPVWKKRGAWSRFFAGRRPGILSAYVLPLLCGLALLLCLSGCSFPGLDNIFGQDSVKTPVQMSEPGIIDKAPESLGAATPRYLIQPYDELEIKFYYSSHLNQKVVVRPDGFVSLQLVHDVKASPLTVDELTIVLKNKYAKYLNEPEISVTVSSLNNQKVFVDGEVERPGMIQMGSYMTILQAISSAGGLKDGSRDDEVLVIRKNGLKKPFVIVVNVAEALEGVDVSQNIALQAHDIVYVPKSAIANVNTWVDLYIRKNIPVGLGYGVYHNI